MVAPPFLDNVCRRRPIALVSTSDAVIWKWADRKDDHYPTFKRQEQRVAQLEAEVEVLAHHLLDYIDSDMACVWMGPAKALAETLRTIIKNREGAK